MIGAIIYLSIVSSAKVMACKCCDPGVEKEAQAVVEIEQVVVKKGEQEATSRAE